MAKIAVICEGASEFNIINHIVSRHNSEHFLNAIQPRIAYGTQANEGGWARVLEHCTDEVFEGIFQLNDYLIIQIDTDCAHIPPFGVEPRFADGTPKSHTRLHAEIKARLVRDISRENRKKYLNRILFAICHNEIECWLLPLYYSDKRGCRTNNCIHLLNDALAKRDLLCVPNEKKNSPQAIRAYKSILKNIRKKSDVIKIANKSWGFEKFVDGLNSLR